MPRIFPRSLLGQSLLAIAVTLLIGQAVSAFLLYRAVEERRDVATANAIAFHLVRTSNRDEFATENRSPGFRRRDGDRRLRLGGDGPRARRALPPPIAGRIDEHSPLSQGEMRDIATETRLQEILTRQGMVVEELVATRRPLSEDRVLEQLAEDRPRLRAILQERQGELVVAGMRLQGEERWIVARSIRPPVEARALWLIGAQTILLFLVLLGATYLVLRRITRPLAQLTQRVESFARTQQAREPLRPQGPADVTRLIAAHNLLESRIASLLDEKDVMLGAIGHDLKTPLAALRVRIESVDDETQRARMADIIEDLRRSLDDILSLARIGRAKSPPESTQLAALVESVVDEFEDMEKPVSFAGADRIVAPVQVTWLRRALRNLIENALRYGLSATITLERSGEWAVLAVEDEGPGIPPDQVAAMLEPFRRGEASRNRGTGGAGLGLTITRAIVREHGGELTLGNRPEGGLRAEIRLPLAR
ncbi:sensor histidine kinase [Alteriqipengyuania sp.]|uniref:sensor histidine kinase n=1 Tax=Alteriqipengyuania sp. TaxID=2800692 RepID=UPI003515C06E